MLRLEGRHGEAEFGVGAGEGVGWEVEGGLGGGVAEGGEAQAAGLEGQDAVTLGEAVPGGAGLRRVKGGTGAVRVAALGLVEPVALGLGAVLGGPEQLRGQNSNVLNPAPPPTAYGPASGAITLTRGGAPEARPARYRQPPPPSEDPLRPWLICPERRFRLRVCGPALA